MILITGLFHREFDETIVQKAVKMRVPAVLPAVCSRVKRSVDRAKDQPAKECLKWFSFASMIYRGNPG